MRKGGVVGVDEPHDRTAIGSFNDPAHRSDSGKRNLAEFLSGFQIVQRKFADSVTSPRHRK